MSADNFQTLEQVEKKLNASPALKKADCGIAVSGTTDAARAAASIVLLTTISWGLALFVWGYALVWFLVNDRVKLLAYRVYNGLKTKRGTI